MSEREKVATVINSTKNGWDSCQHAVVTYHTW